MMMMRAIYTAVALGVRVGESYLRVRVQDLEEQKRTKVGECTRSDCTARISSGLLDLNLIIPSGGRPREIIQLCIQYSYQTPDTYSTVPLLILQDLGAAPNMRITNSSTL